MDKRQFTPDNIQELKENEVFVFGSNMNGNHAGGAALMAVQKFGAIEGQSEGFQGQSYAIPTLDKEMKKISVDDLKENIGRFISYAGENQDKVFLMTKIGCGIAGFELNELATVFKGLNFPLNVHLPVEFCVVKGFKGFDKELKCRNFQYGIGKEYTHEGDVKTCEKGFHFCEYPLDIFSYYPPSDSRFCEVEGSGKIDKDNDDTKVAVSNIKIGCELSFKSLIEAAVKFTFERAKWEDKDKATGNLGAASATGDLGAASTTGYRGAASATGDLGAASATGNRGAASATGNLGAASATGNLGAASATGYLGAASATGDRGAASATGYRGAASATGYRGAASATGYRGAASATGNLGAASATGNQGAASATGNRGAASATGNQGAASATGDLGAASATGNRGAASATGYRGAASATGDLGAASATGNLGAASATGYRGAASATGDLGAASATGDLGAASATGDRGIACGHGIEAKAKASKGNWIVLSEWKLDENSNKWKRIAVKSKQVDGKKIKEDVFYILQNGKFVEAE